MHPPHLTDWALIEQMRRIGLVANAEFGALDAAVRSALEDAPEAGQQAMQEAIPRLANIVNGWQININTIGVYGNFYMKRAVIAMLGLGSNAAEDGMYPILLADADGNAVSGDNDYIMHFDADELPPVRSFWSATVYDTDGFQVANEINRFALGDRDPLHYNDDGSLDLYVQNQNPGRTSRRTGFPPPELPSASACGSTCQPREFSTENGHPHPSANAETTTARAPQLSEAGVSGVLILGRGSDGKSRRAWAICRGPHALPGERRLHHAASEARHGLACRCSGLAEEDP